MLCHRSVRLAVLVLIAFASMSLRCGGYKKMWFRISSIVAREGSPAPGMTVTFQVNKLDQSGKVLWDKVVDKSLTVLETGWTPEFICEFDVLYDDRSTEFVEDIRAIATVNDEGDIYKDTATYTPVIFLNDTQGFNTRIDLPRP